MAVSFFHLQPCEDRCSIAKVAGAKVGEYVLGDIDGHHCRRRAVSFDEFADAVLAKSLEGIRQDMQWLRPGPAPGIPVPATPHVPDVEHKGDERAACFERAAELLGLSPATIRKYVSERKLHASNPATVAVNER